MSKRRNPFVEDFIPQSKVHVGLKQFNNNDDRLKNVYEKTLDLLFKGAKKILSQDPYNDAAIISTKKDNMKQLFIGKNGGLQHSGNMVPSNKVNQCPCGGSVEAEVDCAYCDRVLCAGCLHICTRCEKPYCTCCVIVGSEGLQQVCVSCYG